MRSMRFNCIQLGFFTVLGLSLWLFASRLYATNYSFERMIPQHIQPWYFIRPTSIAVGSDGSVWVADAGKYRIQHLLADGTVLGQFGSQGSDPGQFVELSAIAIAPDGSVWVADGSTQRIQHFQADGKLIRQFGSQGSEPGQFFYPRAITVSSDGSIWVADGLSWRIQHFQADGIFISEFVSLENREALLWTSATPLVVTSDGTLWLAGLTWEGGNFYQK